MTRHSGRPTAKDGFDHGFEVAKMIYNEIATDLKMEIEQLNSEIILGEEEDDGEAEEPDNQSD